MKSDSVYLDGEVIENLPNTLFRVKLDEVNKIIMCSLAGKMRQNYIRILRNDRVQVEITASDVNRGRIVYRYPPQRI